MRRLIHYNPGLPHQVDHARAFAACGFDATSDPAATADVHVVSGPYYALQEWRGHPRVLVIDRAWWGDPERVSIGWQKPCGARTFATPKTPREHPKPGPWKTREQSALVLADFGQDTAEIESAARRRFGTVRCRAHPAEGRNQITLEAHLALCDVAIGTRSTALFDALMHGLPCICLDSANPVHEVSATALDSDLVRPDLSEWLAAMAWRQFSLAEIASGLAWNALKEVMP